MWKLNWFKNWDFHDCFTFDILFERPCTYVTLCWLTHYYGIWTFLGFYCYWSEGRNLLWDRPPNPFHWTLKAARKQLMAMLIGCFEWITEAVSYKSYWINMQKNVTGHQVKLTLWPKSIFWISDGTHVCWCFLFHDIHVDIDVDDDSPSGWQQKRW